ncbi:MAG TPA: DUF4082 domain-containing protein [Candidatus Saccharimonadales bacterium]|nr:DUF4082 domain-containing protein [Candidatus Saccharimonadales bacterium]
MEQRLATEHRGRLAAFWTKPYGKIVVVAVFAIIGASAALVSAATTTYGLWNDSAVPRTLSSFDTKSVELGLKFQANVSGQVVGVRFYKGAQNTGTHTGTLWDKNGNKLATVTFTGETGNGWQSAMFAQPVTIAANVTYIISYHAPAGHYSTNTNYFTFSAHRQRHLTALQNTRGSGNGVYAYGASTTFPNQSSNGTNYWVDVLFANKIIAPTPKPAAPSSLQATQNGKAVSLSWAPSLSANPISSYTVVRDGNTLATIAGSTSYTDTNVTAGSTYRYQVQATDNTGAVSPLSNVVSITVSTPTTGGSGGGTGSGGGGTGTGGSGTGGTTASGNFKISGSQILDPSGKPFTPVGANVNGPNFVWQGPTIGQSAIASSVWHWNAVRVNTCYPVGCENGSGYHFNNNNDLTGIVNEYTARHIVVVIDLQQYNPGTFAKVDEATAWWKTTAAQYKDNPYVWFNLLNEPGSGAGSIGQWNTVTGQVAAAVRSVAPNNVIVADGSDFGQEAGDWTCNPAKQSNSGILTYGQQLEQTYGPVVFSTHIYSEWGGGTQGCTNAQLDTRLGGYIDAVHAKNLPLMFGETGTEPNAADNQAYEIGNLPATQTAFRIAPGKNVGILPWHGDIGSGYDLVNGASWTSVNAGGTNLSWMGQDLWDYAHSVNP